jgi:predicted dehydrogenase
MPDRTPAEQDVRLEIVGETGMIHVRDPDDTVTVWDGGGTSAPASYQWGIVHGRITGALLEELRHFYECVRSGSPSDVLRPRDALAAVRTAEAVVRSCETGTIVRL